MTDFKNWQLKINNRIATLSLNRPDHSNGLTPDTFGELGQITQQLGNEKDVWVVILDGHGRHFSIGVDVDLIGQIPQIDDDDFRHRLADMQAHLDDFEALEKPTIAKLHGFCLGGGLILALCCDFRFASQRSVFGFPEAKRGIPVLMGTQRVSRIAGIANTKEMLYLAETFNAASAQRYGLVQQICPPEELDGAVEAFAQKFLDLPPRTVGQVKRILQEGIELPLRESQDLEIETQIELKDSPDFQEAIRSFLEKRPPKFVGE
jgi:enoyl-CoA hydratase/carnithine racemase